MRDGHGYIIEQVRQGAYVKVSAIDTRTGTEASIVGDAKASQEQLAKIAIQKLEYVLRKKK